MILRLAYLAVTNTCAAPRLLPMNDREKDVEILALRHQLGVLQRQLGPRKATFARGDRAFLAALLAPLPRTVLRRLRLLVQPDTVGIRTALTGIRMPRMNSAMERWVQSCRHELLDRTLIWNETHLRQVLHEYEQHYNSYALTRP